MDARLRTGADEIFPEEPEERPRKRSGRLDKDLTSDRKEIKETVRLLRIDRKLDAFADSIPAKLDAFVKARQEHDDAVKAERDLIKPKRFGIVGERKPVKPEKMDAAFEAKLTKLQDETARTLEVLEDAQEALGFHDIEPQEVKTATRTPQRRGAWAPKTEARKLDDVLKDFDGLETGKYVGYKKLMAVAVANNLDVVPVYTTVDELNEKGKVVGEELLFHGLHLKPRQQARTGKEKREASLAAVEELPELEDDEEGLEGDDTLKKLLRGVGGEEDEAGNGEFSTDAFTNVSLATGGQEFAVPAFDVAQAVGREQQEYSDAVRVAEEKARRNGTTIIPPGGSFAQSFVSGEDEEEKADRRPRLDNDLSLGSASLTLKAEIGDGIQVVGSSGVEGDVGYTAAPKPVEKKRRRRDIIDLQDFS